MFLTVGIHGISCTLRLSLGSLMVLGQCNEHVHPSCMLMLVIYCIANRWMKLYFPLLQRQQFAVAQEMFKESPSLTREQKALILGFMAGSRGQLI